MITILSIIFLLGILSYFISKRTKIPSIFLLLLSGLLLSLYPGIKDSNLITTELIRDIGILSLIFIVFDTTSRFKLKEFDHFSYSAIYLTIVFSLVVLALIGTFSYFYFSFPIVIALAFAGSLIGTDPSAISNFMDVNKNKSIRLLFVESIINSPLTIVIPVVLIEYIQIAAVSGTSIMNEFIIQFLTQIVTGIGAGFLVGLLFFKLMRKEYSEVLSPIAMFTAAILSYSLAEILNGSGIFSITTFGLFFGNINLKRKITLHRYSKIASKILEIVVFVMIGFLFDFSMLSWKFLFDLLILFALYSVARIISVFIVFRKSNYSITEKMFISFIIPKGIATAVVIITFSINRIFTVEIINLLISLLILSVISSTVSLHVLKDKITDYSAIKPKTSTSNLSNHINGKNKKEKNNKKSR